ncbi:MAG TPA: integrase [Desulfobulbaceae bacterium]|nr:integrase [Desulfobulbaceae bacterium]
MTKRNIESVTATGKRQHFFDDELPGLAIRVSEIGKVSFYYTYRYGKGRAAVKKWVHIGAYPAWTPEQARQRVKELAAQVVTGIDPAQEVRKSKTISTVADIAKLFLTEHVEQKLKPKSIRLYKGAISAHILPAIGKMSVEDVSHRDVAKLHHSLKEHPYMANRTAAVMSKFFNWCEVNGYRARGSNPVVGLEKYKEEKKLEFLKSDELSAIGASLEALEKEGQISTLAAAALRLLMLTGMRLMEVLSLKWNYLDLDEKKAELPDSKTGFKVVPLSLPVLEILQNLPIIDQYVFPSSTSASGHMEGLRKPWKLLYAGAKLQGRWRVHDLRHAFASMMVNSGASLPVIGKVLGHAMPSTTARYAHLEKNPAQQAAEDAAAKIAAVWQTGADN